MAYCDVCGNYDDSHLLECGVEDKSYETRPDYQPDLYYYWDAPIEEDYSWRAARPQHDCLCEICFDILNEEGKIKWKEQTLLLVAHSFPTLFKSGLYYKSNQRSKHATYTNCKQHDRG